jgi:hypothetical protein
MIGTTFSHPHLEYLNLDIDQALEQALTMNFSYLRLGAYWNRIESEPQHYDFSFLSKILNKCEQAKQAIVMTVGVKAPRWPEFYWPDHINSTSFKSQKTKTQLLKFVEQTVSNLKKYDCITHWQVENEPLDPSGPDEQKIPFKFLQQEVELVKKLDPRPIIINLWGNDLFSRGLFPRANQLADVIGLDLYPRQFVKEIFGQSVYRGPAHNQKQLKRLLANTHKPIWITELQAEPWEKDEDGYLSNNPGSISPEKLAKNIKQTQQLPVNQILLWGFEYWWWQAQQGNGQYLETVKRFIANKFAN